MDIIRETADKYQPLFNLMSEEHGLTLTISEMDDIIAKVDKVKQLFIHGVGISFCFDDDEISDLVTDWVDGFKNISQHTKTNLSFGFQEGIYKIKEVLKK